MGLYKSGGLPIKPNRLTSGVDEDAILGSFDVNMSDWLTGFGITPSTGNKGKSNNYAFTNALARKKFEFEIGKELYKRSQDEAEAKAANDAAKLKKANFEASIAAMKKRYESGEYAKAFEEQLAGLQELGTEQEQQISRQSANLEGDINTQYGTAENAIQSSYDALARFLSNNPNDPYSDQNYTAGRVDNTLQALLASQGVSNDPVNAQVAATQAGLEAGTQEFNNLNRILSSIAKQSDVSRQTEASLGRSQALTGLAQQKAGQVGALKATTASALQRMWENINEGKTKVRTNLAEAKNELEEWLAANGLIKDAPANTVAELSVLADLLQGNTDGRLSRVQ